MPASPMKYEEFVKTIDPANVDRLLAIVTFGDKGSADALGSLVKARLREPGRDHDAGDDAYTYGLYLWEAATERMAKENLLSRHDPRADEFDPKFVTLRSVPRCVSKGWKALPSSERDVWKRYVSEIKRFDAACAQSGVRILDLNYGTDSIWLVAVPATEYERALTLAREVGFPLRSLTQVDVN